MEIVTYKDIAARHGHPYALNLLRVVENLAQTSNKVVSIDCEVRFEKAIKALCKIDSKLQS